VSVVNLHAVLPRSCANGPGTRFAVWFQGCSLGCPGCFNPETHPFEPRIPVPPGELVARLEREQDRLEGITVSGGEPLQQAEALVELVSGVRARTALSVVLFSGYSLAEIEAMRFGPVVLGLVDVLIAGRYIHSRRLGSGLRGSANQRIHLLTGRYSLPDIESCPSAEVVVGPDGTLTVSGIAPPGQGRVTTTGREKAASRTETWTR